MSLSAFYFQGSQVGYGIGLVLIALTLYTGLKFFKTWRTRTKLLIWFLVPLLWTLSFINVGHNRANMPRHQYNTIQHVLTAPKLEAVKSDTATRASVMAEAEIKRKQSAQENQ